MDYNTHKQEIMEEALRYAVSMNKDERISAAELLGRYTDSDLSIYDKYLFFSELSRRLAEEGYIVSVPADAEEKSRFPEENPFCVSKATEIPPVGDHAPMGWNSWDSYGASVTEDIVRQNADFMAKYLKPLGYEYVVVDIEWSQPKMVGQSYEPFTDLEMDEYGRLIPAENRFPSAAGGKGFKPLADYVHSLGLKFGIHIMRGIPRMAVHRNLPVYGSDLTARQVAQEASICQWNTDMYGLSMRKGGKAYYDSIFRLYAEWGVDFIKIDDICRELPREKEELLIVSQALQDCGREMVLSLSPGPAVLDEAETYKKTAHMWRITDDFWDQWPLLYNMFERAEKWCIHTGAGHYPDADMLPVGMLRNNEPDRSRTRFTETEQITMMSLWCIFRAPLMIGGEMTSFDEFTMKLLTNPEIIGMQKNARHPHPVWRKKVNGIEHVVWTAQNAEGGRYAAVFNLGEKDSSIELCLSDLEASGAVSVRELWTGAEKNISDQIIRADLPAHGAEVYLIR